MPSEQGLVSIVVPVHNKAKTRICSEHVRKQTYPNIELIVVNFKRFPTEKRNYGYLKSKGEYVFFLDENSHLSPSVISAYVDKFKQEFDVVRARLGSLGMVSLDAIACGRPVVTYISSEFPEYKNLPLKNVDSEERVVNSLKEVGTELWKKEHAYLMMEHEVNAIVRRLLKICNLREDAR